MIFDLTEELVDEIISAMENQENDFLFDAENLALIPFEKSEIGENKCKAKADEERFYSLPDWSPADGFSAREDFVRNLHSPVAHEDLQAVLHSGRGVFKNFRNVLKNYPEVEKKWHIYKYRIMSQKINDWYDSLREVWGLEKLDHLSDSEESLVYDDFSFRPYEEKYKDIILSNISAYQSDEDLPDSDLPREVSEAINSIWLGQFGKFEKMECAGQTGYLCFTLSDEYAGSITASQVREKGVKLVFITSLFVPKQFRGLGICTELISLCLSEVRKSGKQWIILPEFIIPEFLEPLLIRTGFRKTPSGYILGV